ILVSLFYSIILGHLFPKKLFYTLIVVFVSFAIINAFGIQGTHAIPTYTRTLESVFIIFYVILYLYNIISELKIKKLETDYAFWISAGFLVYFCSAIINNVIANTLTGPDHVIIRQSMWAFNALFLLILYVLIAIGLWTYRRQMTT
ncbi:MAG: hypothetical protein HKO56_04275, partial [Bacteroidia bacterium]|nr:hypothetical protein [Bacteroidia bacterium]